METRKIKLESKTINIGKTLFTVSVFGHYRLKSFVKVKRCEAIAVQSKLLYQMPWNTRTTAENCISAPKMSTIQLSLILSCKIFILSIFQLVQSSNQLEKDPHNFLIVPLWRELDHHKSPSNWTNLRSSKKFPLIHLSSFLCRGFGQWVANNP